MTEPTTVTDIRALVEDLVRPGNVHVDEERVVATVPLYKVQAIRDALAALPDPVRFRLSDELSWNRDILSGVQVDRYRAAILRARRP